MKQDRITVDDFYANDVFFYWKKLIKKAKYSVTIYSPFINEILNELLNHVVSGVKIEIYTRLDGDTLCGNIKALLKACEQGANIFDLPKLHAKVLLVDNEFISMGSQNFTSGGRTNKEASFASKFSFVGSEFLNELKKWNTCAVKISERNLKKLDENIVEDCRRFQKGKSKLKKKIEEIRKKYIPREFSIDRTATLTRYYGRSDLKCRYNEHLTNWKKKRVSAELKKGDFYPIINLDTKQMIYARVSKTVISFVCGKIERYEVTIGDDSYNVEIVFPEKVEKISNDNITNVVLYFKNKSIKKIQLKYFFPVFIHATPKNSVR